MTGTQDHSPDPDVEAVFKWLMSYIPASEWQTRRRDIESHFQAVANPTVELGPLARLNYLADPLGWYLYLVECSLFDPVSVEVNQAARVLPFFRKLGEDLDLLKSIGGLERQVSKLFLSKQPDSELFEMLVALVWARNDCSNVEFVEDKSQKSPDIYASKHGERWGVEAKRLGGSEYSLKEREKWLKLWKPVSIALVEGRLPIVVDVTFHVELTSLPDDYLEQELCGKLRFVACSGTLMSNDVMTVAVKFVELNKIANHLRKYRVKRPSRQLDELITGEWPVAGRGSTTLMKARSVKIGHAKIFNDYVDDIEWAAGATWHCDAERALEQKARDIRKRLSEATEQLRDDQPGVVHIGLETYDGMLVERERYDRILNTLRSFDPRGKDLRHVYCHLYQSYTPPDKLWDFDETVYCFGVSPDSPIVKDTTVVPFDVVREGVHWNESGGSSIAQRLR